MLEAAVNLRATAINHRTEESNWEREGEGVDQGSDPRFHFKKFLCSCLEKAIQPRRPMEIVLSSEAQKNEGWVCYQKLMRFIKSVVLPFISLSDAEKLQQIPCVDPANCFNPRSHQEPLFFHPVHDGPKTVIILHYRRSATAFNAWLVLTQVFRMTLPVLVSFVLEVVHVYLYPHLI